MQTAHQLTEMYKSTIEETLGLIANVDDAGDIRFKHPELGVFYISLDAINDPEFMVLHYPAFIDINSGLNEEQLRIICNQLNAKCKGTKLFVVDNADHDVYASLQMLVALPGEIPTREYLSATLKRALSMIKSSVTNFAHEAKQLLRVTSEQSLEVQLH